MKKLLDIAIILVLTIFVVYGIIKLPISSLPINFFFKEKGFTYTPAITEAALYGDFSSVKGDVQIILQLGYESLDMDFDNFLDHARAIFYSKATSEDEKWIAINIVKSTAEDSTESPADRAAALNTLIEFMFNDPDGLVVPIEAADLDEAYPTYREVMHFENVQNRAEALFLLAKFSNGLHPTAYANYMMAVAYAGSQKPIILSDSDKATYGALVDKHIARAIDLFETERSNYDPRLVTTREASLYHFAATAAANANLFDLETSLSYEDYFKNAIAFSESIETPNNIAPHTEPYSRFYYALFKQALSNETGVNDVTIEQLSAIASIPESESWRLNSFNEHLRGLFNLPHDQVGYFRNSLLFEDFDIVVDAVPEFRLYISQTTAKFPEDRD